MGEADLTVQYYLATDASKWCLEGVLIQLADSSPGIKAMHSYKKNICMIMIMFFSGWGMRYDTTERETTLFCDSQMVSYKK